MRFIPSAFPPMRIARDTKNPNVLSVLTSHLLDEAVSPATSGVDPPADGAGAAAAPNVTMTPSMKGTAHPFTRAGLNFILLAAASAAFPNGVLASGAEA